MKLLNVIRRPWAAWVAMLVILCGTTAVATSPSLWTRWVVANASATPSPNPTGFSGPVVVAQATNAPTPQPGNIDITGTVFAGLGSFQGVNANTGTIRGASDGVTNTYLPPVYTVSGAAQGSSLHAVFGTVSYVVSGTCAALTICSASANSNQVTLSGAAAFSAYNTYKCGMMSFANGGGIIVTNNGVATAAGSSGSVFWVTLFNQSNAGVAGTVNMNYYCVGT